MAATTRARGVTFTVTVSGVNDPPSFTKGGNPTVLEDAGAQSISGWATSILAWGRPDESGQNVSFVVDSKRIPDLFSSRTGRFLASGTLTFTPAANANGTSTVTLHAVDDGGTANGGRRQRARRRPSPSRSPPVNDATKLHEGTPTRRHWRTLGLQTVTNWATNILGGPAE